MKKTALLGLLVSGLIAADEGWYVGADAYKTRADITVSNGVATEKQNFTRYAQTAKVGYYFDNNSRINAFYQHYNSSQNSTGHAYGFNYDYLIGESALKPFIGGMVGYSKYLQSDVGLDIKLNGTFIGADVGLNYAFGENISLEGGYRYIWSNAHGTFADSTSEAKVDTMKNWFVGANYKF